ncbi:Agamous-like MADS-box -like protein AGL8 [Cardamine amara subsp. amara]|uniref:Agamous-like MADS-box -like protein AGL8 n=1 Tax=Cardamine amara subsp. amara TaxID=228776 RepID=A0ABD0ZH37_CARAN
MERILDRYERCSYAGQDIPTPSLDSQGECSIECSKLLRMVDVMQKSVRHLRGEEVEALSIRELHGLEMQLDTALKRTRSRKNQLMVESITQLQKKEKELKELKKQLTKKADQTEDFEPQIFSQGSSSTLAMPPCESPHLLPLSISPPPPPQSFRDTSHMNGSGELNAGTLILPTNTTLPHWMTRLNGE